MCPGGLRGFHVRGGQAEEAAREQLRRELGAEPSLADLAARVGSDEARSVRVSLASQGLFVNDVAVRFAAQLLYELFSRGASRSTA